MLILYVIKFLPDFKANVLENPNIFGKLIIDIPVFSTSNSGTNKISKNAYENIEDGKVLIGLCALTLSSYIANDHARLDISGG